MTRFLLQDSGEELTVATASRLRARSTPVVLRVLEPAPPFRDSQAVHVRPGAGAGVQDDDIVLRCAGERLVMSAAAGGAAPDAGEVLGRVTAIQRGGMVASVEHGLLRRLPWRWRPAAVDLLEVLWRVRRPLTPPLFQGDAETCLRSVRRKYDSAAEVRQYARQAVEEATTAEIGLLRRHLPVGGRILDVGCGAGREAIAFAREGYRVTAIDVAPAMIAAARATVARLGLDIEFRIQCASALADAPGSYDGVFCAGVLHHIPGRRLRIETLRRLRRALVPGGALIVGVYYRERLGFFSRTRAVDLLRTVGRALLGPAGFAEPGDNWIGEVSEASDPLAPAFFHHFRTPAEVRAELQAAGFTAAEVDRGWWVGQP